MLLLVTYPLEGFQNTFQLYVDLASAPALDLLRLLLLDPESSLLTLPEPLMTTSSRILRESTFAA
jgi:hypothetical protein